MTQLIEVACAFMSAVVICVVCARQPSSAQCPVGWWLPEGVRDDGAFVCRPLPAARWEVNVRGGWRDASELPPGELRGRVYCDKPQRAVTNDGRSVLCQR